MMRFSLSVACTLLLISTATSAAESCTPIVFREQGSAVLKSSGNYCLTKQMTIGGSYKPWVWEGPRYLSDDHIALVLAANDVTVDLQGNAIVSDAREVMAGVQTALVNMGESTKLGESGPYGYRKESWGAAYRNVTIRNGSVRLNRGDYGLMFVGSGVYYNNLIDSIPIHFRPSHARVRGCGDDRELHGFVPPSAWAYPERNITLERLQVRSPGCGVLVQGAKTIIRDSVIETDAQVGLWIFGPNAVIENNTIIVHEVSKEFLALDGVRPHDAAIRLHHADGSIVRNNHIIFRSRLFSGTKGDTAIDLQESKNVVIENNRIENIMTLRRMDTDSNSVDKNNQLK